MKAGRRIRQSFDGSEESLVNLPSAVFGVNMCNTCSGKRTKRLEAWMICHFRQEFAGIVVTVR